MPSWPPSLPDPVANSLSVSPRANLLIFQPDVGRPLTRRRTSARLVDYSAQLYVDEAQRRTLDEFHNGTCADGSLSFTMQDWIGGLPASMQWTAPPQYEQAGPSGKWLASVAFVKFA